MTKPTEYSQEQLENAFTLIADKTDWKAPINATVSAEQIGAVCAAVLHFTATIPKVTAVSHDGPSLMFEVTAKGYRLGPAGDH